MGIDIVGYSVLMSRDEEETHRRVGAEMDRVSREIDRSHGRVFSFAGDGLMAEFPSAVEALKCGLRIQRDLAKRSASLSPDQRIVFRLGINSGEIVLQQDRIGGTAVNIAARLEAIADPGGIALSDVVYQQVRRVVSAGYTYFGEPNLKNIREPVPVFMIPAAECASWVGMPALTRQTDVSGTSGTGSTKYRPSLAVLPFRTLQKDEADAYFAEGIVDDIIHVLAGIKAMLVISRSSTQTFARAPLDLRRVGHDLDVRYVLHGSVRRAGQNLRIVVELCEAQAGTVIWEDRFDGSLDELFELQNRIALRVATLVVPHLREQELMRAVRKHPESMTAYDLTLQALNLFDRVDHASLEQSERLLERAIAADPNYGPAYSHLAAVRMRIVAQGWSTDQATDAAFAADHARAALEREPNDAIALAIYGHVQSYLFRNYRVARQYLDRALDVGPSCPLAWGYSSLTSGYLGEHDKAIPGAEHALRLSPIGLDSSRYQHYLSQAYYLADRFEEAIAWGRTSAALAPANVSNLTCLTASLVALGEFAAARNRVDEVLRLVPTFRLSAFCARTPLPPDVANRVAERLRNAGMPD
jgi:TolB-like protein